MTVVPDSGCWAAAAAAELRQIVDRVACSPAPEFLGESALSFAELAANADVVIQKLTEQIERDRCIYVIMLDEAVDRDAFMNAFDKARQLDDLKLPQKNHNSSEVLYVGSSCATGKRAGTLRSRLKQHLVGAPRVTYALSLAKWSSHLRGGIVVRAWQYPSMGKGEDDDQAARRTVLTVEDWLSGNLKPMLGRRGTRH